MALPRQHRSTTLTASRASESTVHILEGTDQGFATLKSGGRTSEKVWAEAVAAMKDWLPPRSLGVRVSPRT